MSPEEEDYFLNPPPGSAAARAVEFGIDLTLTLENLRHSYLPDPRGEPLRLLRGHLGQPLHRGLAALCRLDQPGHHRERHHRGLVHHDDVVRQPVAPVVPEPGAAVGSPAEQPVQGLGGESAEPVAVLDTILVDAQTGRLDQPLPVGNEGAGVVVAAGSSRAAQAPDFPAAPCRSSRRARAAGLVAQAG